MVESAGLENRYTRFGYRGFESRPLRQAVRPASEATLAPGVVNLVRWRGAGVVERARLESACSGEPEPRVRIPPSPPCRPMSRAPFTESPPWTCLDDADPGASATGDNFVGPGDRIKKWSFKLLDESSERVQLFAAD